MLSSSPPLQLSRKVVRTRSKHSAQSAHTLHYVRTHPGTITEWNLISAKLARLCGDSRPHWVQTEKAEIPSWSWAPRVDSHSASQTKLLSPMGLIVAKSAPFTTRRKVANHSPRNLPKINKPQARISGVEISMCYPIDSNTCTTSVITRVDRPLT
jgi:hypothetical protein